MEEVRTCGISVGFAGKDNFNDDDYLDADYNRLRSCRRTSRCGRRGSTAYIRSIGKAGSYDICGCIRRLS